MLAELWTRARALLTHEDTPTDSLLTLLAANLVPLLGVLFLGWDLGVVMLLFWAENLVVGAFSIVRMAFITGWFALFAVPFFVFHFGLFSLGHLIFLLFLFVASPEEATEMTLGEVFGPMVVPLVLGVGAMVVSHGVSFWRNFVRRGERDTLGATNVMGAAYKRVAIMHVAIILGAFPVLALGEPVWGLAVLVLLKMGVDAWSHVREHRGLAKEARARRVLGGR